MTLIMFDYREKTGDDHELFKKESKDECDTKKYRRWK